jgi:hypothetical protein
MIIRAPARSTHSRNRRRLQPVPVARAIARRATCINAPKRAMIKAVRARGFDPKDDNEADAIAILFWAIETGGGVA